MVVGKSLTAAKLVLIGAVLVNAGHAQELFSNDERGVFGSGSVVEEGEDTRPERSLSGHWNMITDEDIMGNFIGLGFRAL